MTSTNKSTFPKVLMLVYSMPPFRMGGAEMQAVKLIPYLNALGVTTSIITPGRLGQARTGRHHSIEFTRIFSIFNLFVDLPAALVRRKRTTTGPTKIVYDDAREATSKVTGKVGLAARIRYQLFFVNSLIYLWPRRREFDIIHVHMMEWPGIVGTRLGKILKKPVVIKDSTMNGIDNLLRYPAGPKKQKAITSYAYCVAMTRQIESVLSKAGVPVEKTFLIPNGIEIPLELPKKDKFRNVVIFVGNLTQQPAKGVDILLMAWKKVSGAVPDAVLQLVGDGDLDAYRDFCKLQSIDKSVVFLGKRNDVRDLLLEADIFVLPSRREGMSNALMEAMTCGMPVVATDISGNQDLIEHEISGVLVPSASVSRLADALIFMLSHPRRARSMGLNAYKSVADKCDVGHVAEKYLRMYQQILQNAT